MSEALALGWRLVEAAEVLALQLSELGDIDLPPAERPAAAVSAIETAAPLYLAAELEAARLLPAVETLAGISISGGLRADIGEAAPLLFRFWKHRNERFSASERQAFFARLFGTLDGPNLALAGGRNTAFEGLMIDLAEAIYKLDPAPLLGRPASDVRLRMAANRLASNLIPRSGGMAAFAARDLLRAIEEAVAILKKEPLQRALRARGVWSAVRNVARLYLNEEVEIGTHVRRGKSGMVVLAWLAEAFPRLDDHVGALIPAGHQVLAAATTWLETSLILEEQHQPTSPTFEV